MKKEILKKAILKKALMNKFLHQLPIYLILLITSILAACKETATTNNLVQPVEQEPTSGRGAIVSVTPIKTYRVGEVDTFLRSKQLITNVKYGVSEYKIIYETITAQGVKTQASGFLAIPNSGVAPALGYPIASYQHGTIFNRSDVPSAKNYESVMATYYSAAGGYVCPAPDYLGMGVSSGFHPYVVAKPTATAVIDMLRATRWFCKRLGLKLNNQIFLFGYSEGGYATMATHKEIEENYSTEFNIAASCPMAGPHDLSGVMRETILADKKYNVPAFLPYTILGYQAAYNIFNSLADVFKTQYVNAANNWYTNASTSFQTALPSVPKDMLSSDFLVKFSDSNYILRKRLSENDLYRWTPKAPMKLSHSTTDDLVPYQNSVVAYNSFKQRGASNVILDTNNLGSHTTASGIILALNIYWFDTFKK